MEKGALGDGVERGGHRFERDLNPARPFPFPVPAVEQGLPSSQTVHSVMSAALRKVHLGHGHKPSEAPADAPAATAPGDNILNCKKQTGATSGVAYLLAKLLPKHANSFQKIDADVYRSL